MNNGFHKIEMPTVAQKIVDQICDTISQGIYKPGDRIPTELELAKLFNCGRNSVREAVKILTAHGVLEIRRAEGTFVASGISKAMVNPLIYGLILSSHNSQLEMIEFQREIDKAVSRLSTKNRTEEDIKIITSAYENLMEELSKTPYDIKAIYAADRKYHDVIADSTHNEFMKIANQAIWELLGKIIDDEILTIMQNEPGHMIKMHKDQYEAIIRQDEIAAEAAIPAKYFIERGL